MRRWALLGLAVLAASAASAAPSDRLRVAVPTPSLSLGHPYMRDAGSGTKPVIFDALTEMTREGQLKPALALSWSLESPLVWRFRLRPGVVFQNGEPFDAETVVHNIAYLKSPAAAGFQVTPDIAGVTAARKIDALTVDILTAAPDPLLPKRMSLVWLVPPKAWDKLGPEAFARTPSGTGAYRIVEWGPGAAAMRFEAFDQSWRKPRSIRRVDVRLIGEGPARLQALLADQVDLAVNLAPDDVAVLKEAGYQVAAVPGPYVLALALRSVRDDASPLKDKRVRQAMLYAIDRAAIVREILGGLVTVPSQLAPPGVIGYNDALAPYPYDPAKARALLIEAGYPTGFAVAISVFGGMAPADRVIFQKAAQDLGAVGIRVALRPLAFPDFMRRLNTGEWDGVDGFSLMFRANEFFDAARPLEEASCAFRHPFFCDAASNALLTASATEMDPGKRAALLHEVMARYHDLVPALPLTGYSSLMGLSPRVREYRSRTDSIVYEEMSLTP
jgi:peptide/nickel transport system substrate-binding protein